MAGVEEATQRLYLAVERLERALTSRESESDDRATGSQAALDQMRAENNALKQSAASVSERLEAAIVRVNAVLGE